MKAQFNSFGGFATPIKHEPKIWYERDPVVASFLEITKKQSERYGVENVDK